LIGVIHIGEEGREREGERGREGEREREREGGSGTGGILG
jgi:hypothetical protein